MAGYGYGYGGYGGYGGGCGAGFGYGGWGIRWIYALLVLIVIVLQFGRTFKDKEVIGGPCDDVAIAAGSRKGLIDDQLIDNSVLFIIVVFLLILCSGCWTGGYANYGAAGSGVGFGY